MQSGITASAELQAAFKSFVPDTSKRALILVIENEAIQPLDLVASTASSLHSDLSNLAPHLQPNRALYILLRRDDGRLAAITYVPNAAPVRQKMLFASTQRTLVKDLGAEHFSETFFTTEAAELSAEGWAKHEAHSVAEQPLTQEERDREDLKEAEVQEQGGTGRRGAGYGTSHGSSGVSTNVGPGVEDALGALKQGNAGGELVQLRIDVPTETIQIESTSSNVPPSALATSISSTEPRYSFYRHNYPDAVTSQPTTVIIFIYTCPTAAKIKERMLYASSRHSASNLAERAVGLTIAKKLEASDPADINIEGEFTTKVESKTGFSKPKRPGKR